MNPQRKHPWRENRITAIDRRYLLDRGVKLEHIAEERLARVALASARAAAAFDALGGEPPLLSAGRELEVELVRIPEGALLPGHGNTDFCPNNIREVNFAPGCQLNCQYCLAVAQNEVQTKVRIYDGYAGWLRNQLRQARREPARRRGYMYYFSPKTEAFSPQMVRSGITQEVLEVFAEHIAEVTEERGECLDTIFVVTKGGVQELTERGSGGTTVLEALKDLRDHIQINISIAPLGGNLEFREALEPGARSMRDRLSFMERLQQEGILASGVLAEPVFFPFADDANFFAELQAAGVMRIATDLLTSTFENLSVVNQIVGWFYPEAEGRMWQSYLQSTAPMKSGGRLTLNVDEQVPIYSRLQDLAKAAGIDAAVYCTLVEVATGLGIAEYKKSGCMAHVLPHPGRIKAVRQRQPGYSGTVEDQVFGLGIEEEAAFEVPPAFEEQTMRKERLRVLA